MYKKINRAVVRKCDGKAEGNKDVFTIVNKSGLERETVVYKIGKLITMYCIQIKPCYFFNVLPPTLFSRILFITE